MASDWLTASPAVFEASLAGAGVYAISIYAAMLLCAGAMLRLRPVQAACTQAGGRYGALDGLRGLLASGVLIHHTLAAHGYFTRGRWEWSANALLNHLGQSTVAMFFMITGFLFATKAMAADVDWRALYLSRVARLMPLYFFVVALVFGIVFALSRGVLHEPMAALAVEALRWLSFGRPDINGFGMSWTLIAGVNWSLKYEAAFYLLAVPTIHVISKRVSVDRLLVLGLGLLLVMLAFRRWAGEGPGISLWVAHFLAGIAAAAAFKLDRLRGWMQSPRFGWCGGIGAMSLLAFVNAYGPVQVLLTTLVFIAVVGGFSASGLLASRAALWLGDISYGVYLLHGLVLWLVLHGLREVGLLAGMNWSVYWALAIALSAVVVVLASASYVLLERPMVGWGRRMAVRRPAAAPAIGAG